MTTITDKLAEALRDMRRDLQIAVEFSTARNKAMLLESIEPANRALAEYDAERAKSYTLAEIRNGTGWPNGVRFIAISE